MVTPEGLPARMPMERETQTHKTISTRKGNHDSNSDNHSFIGISPLSDP